jgi:hypothetical protein
MGQQHHQINAMQMHTQKVTHFIISKCCEQDQEEYVPD